MVNNTNIKKFIVLHQVQEIVQYLASYISVEKEMANFRKGSARVATELHGYGLSLRTGLRKRMPPDQIIMNAGLQSKDRSLKNNRTDVWLFFIISSIF